MSFAYEDVGTINKILCSLFLGISNLKFVDTLCSNIKFEAFI